MNVSLDGGGTLVLATFDGERAEGTVDRACPPGSRIEGQIGGARVRCKVERCRATAEGGFSVRIRFLDLDRTLRDAIRSALAQP